MKRYLQLLSFSIFMALLIDIPKHVLSLCSSVSPYCMFVNAFEGYKVYYT